MVNSADQEAENVDRAERDVLVLNYTMACPLKCDFCCYGCGPRRSEKMPLPLAKRLIREAAELPNFSSVGFTGGEIFLFYNDLLELSKQLIESNLPFTLATAAHWASTLDKANEMISPLVRNGLRRANISCDPSHEAYVPRNYVLNAAKAFASFQVPTYLVGTFIDQKSCLESFVPDLVGKPFINFRTKRVAEVGRAHKARIDYSDLDPSERQSTCYRQINHDIVVFWDGKVYPCCSTFNRASPGLSIGNANQKSLRDLTSIINSSLLFRTMKRRGFERLYEIIAGYDIELRSRLPDPASFPGACSLCSAIFSDRSTYKMLLDVFARYETDAIFNMRGILAKQIGEDKVAALLDNISSATKWEQDDACGK